MTTISPAEVLSAVRELLGTGAGLTLPMLENHLSERGH